MIRGSKAAGNKDVTMVEDLQKLVENLQAETSNLRAPISSGRPTAPQDLSLISFIHKWSGTENSVGVNEFFELVESSARIGNWNNVDKIHISVLKLTEIANSFYSSNLELHDTGISWGNFKAKFLYRCRYVKSNQCHFMQPQTSRQRKNETP